jgi:enoyl-CoA hydratase/carnithine racemase
VAEPLVRLETEDGVAGVVFSSPPVNALSHDFLGALDEALDAIPEGTRAVAVWSEVPRVFMAGADLDFLAHGERERQRELPEFRNHFACTVFCAFFACSSACAASGGM